jgi:hypothetical protein
VAVSDEQSSILENIAVNLVFEHDIQYAAAHCSGASQSDSSAYENASITSNYLLRKAHEAALASMIVPFRNPCARATRCRNYSPGQTFVPLRQSLSARATESYHGTYFGAFTDLKPWQRQRLEEAFEEGRRRVGASLPTLC